MGRIKQLWTDLRSSLWFLPSMVALGCVILAYELIALDLRGATAWVARWPRLFAADPEGSRAMLSAIASSMITVAGVGFSITIVALAQSSIQYSPRVLRNFMRDRSNQVVLGAFVGIFAYCLVVLRNIISTGGDKDFVPALAVLVGFLLSLVGVGFLIYFIHHIATSIQASHMVESIAAETIAAVEKICAEKNKQADPGKQAEAEPVQWYPILSDTTGYLQRIETASLMRLAAQRDVAIKMGEGIGQFVVVGQPFAWASAQPDEKLPRAVNRCCAVGAYRTVDQDPGFGIRQIVDIALKALSAGINDTGTAVTCLDYLSAILCRMAVIELEPVRYYMNGKLRLLVPRQSFGDFVNDAFDQILENAAKNKAIQLHALTALERLSHATKIEGRRHCFERQLRTIRELCGHVVTASAQEQIAARADAVRDGLVAEGQCSVPEGVELRPRK